MNMKRIVFKIAKSFCACFITLLFFSCSNSESVMEKERKSTVIIDIKQNGLGYELKSKEVPYITRASGRNIEQFYLSVYREYLQPIITQYFIDNKSEIWLLFLIAHSKR